jgi:serine/threonine-protein kinase
MSSIRACPVCDQPIPDDMMACPFDGTPFDSTRPNIDPLIGVTLGEYRLERRIGVGGQGIVYAAIQPVIGKRAAVKVLLPEVAGEPSEARRLLDEAKAVNAIGSRAVVDVFGFGQLDDGRHYLVMEFLDGVSLEDRLAQGRLPVAEALVLLEEIAAALSVVHARNVVHRDLKPSNVFIVRDVSSQYVKLLDFGLARRTENEDLSVAQTSEDHIVGTPKYLAPEQARGDPVSPATDLYGLGAMGFEMLTGSPVFAGKSSFEVMNAHANAPVPRPSEFEPSLPPELDALILRLLSKAPSHRPRSAAEVKDKLARIRRSLARSAHRPEPPHRRPWVVGTAAAGAAAFLAPLLMGLLSRHAATAPDVGIARPLPTEAPAPHPAAAPKPVEAAPAPPHETDLALPPLPTTSPQAAPVPAEAHSAIAAPPSAPHAPKAPTTEQLNARIDRLRQQLERSDRSDRELGLALLNKHKLALTRATTAADRASIAQKVEQVENLYRSK